MEVTQSSKIDLIRRVFAPATSDLAIMFHTSADQIYRWCGTESMSGEKSHILDDLVSAAKLIDAAGFAHDRSLLRRFIKGKRLSNLVHDGESAVEAASILVSYLEREAAERERLQRRLADRTTSRSIDLEWGWV